MSEKSQQKVTSCKLQAARRKAQDGTVYLLMGVVFFLMTFSLLNFQIVLAEESPCLACHVKFKKPAKTVHAAVAMGCETCHQAVEGVKHAGQKGSMKLTQDVPGLCIGCHDQAKFKGKVVHSPVAGGMCTSCHDPHQTESAKLLISDQPDLCYNCHDKAMFAKKNVHAAVMMGCTSCHSPHVSENAKLLPKAINPLCGACHAAKATGRHVMAIPGKGFHPIGGRPEPGNPGKQMSCVSCHEPHSSDFEKLYPSADVCGKCHKF
jgi:predicted CXXCH cytochrome family protein